MVPLRIRLQYGLRIDNPILQEIKSNYSFPYVVAAHASTVLSEYFHTIVPEAEIGYLALCFALSMKRQDQERHRHNILLVCASGAGSAKLFEYRFREVFGEYLDKVETCNIESLARKDFSQVDYVFSTVPVSVSIPVPVYEVQYFFERHNVAEVERILKHSGRKGIETYFDKTLFFTDMIRVSKDTLTFIDFCLYLENLTRIF
jgi:lichenan operon transcriptional antiterminator